MGNGGTCPIWKCCSVLSALIVIQLFFCILKINVVKVKVEEVLMYHFQNMSACEGFAPSPLICPLLQKNPAGTHVWVFQHFSEVSDHKIMSMHHCVPPL